LQQESVGRFSDSDLSASGNSGNASSARSENLTVSAKFRMLSIWYVRCPDNGIEEERLRGTSLRLALDESSSTRRAACCYIRKD
jgi:hypothetical protein